MFGMPSGISQQLPGMQPCRRYGDIPGNNELERGLG